MIDDMGIFRTTVGVAPRTDHENQRDIEDVLVDTGSEYSWLPEELLAAGRGCRIANGSRGRS